MSMLAYPADDGAVLQNSEILDSTVHALQTHAMQCYNE